MGNQQNDYRKTLLIGNGPNLAVIADNSVTWASLLNELLKKCALCNTAACSSSLLTFSEKMSLLERSVNSSEEAEELTKMKKKWLHKMSKLEFSPVYPLLRCLLDNVDEVLTTNYDKLLDKLAKSRTKVKITHIHGRCDRPDSVIMFPSEYKTELEKAQENPPDWMKSLLENEVHICGLGMRREELLIWHVLEQRQQRILSSDSLDEKGKPVCHPRIFLYHFYEDSPAGKQQMLHDIEWYRTYRIILEPIFVRDQNYFKAWEDTVGRIIGNLVQLPHDNFAALEILEQGTTNKRTAGKNRNVSILMTPDGIYPDCALVSRKEIVKHTALQDTNGRPVSEWYFLCAMPHQERRLFKCPLNKYKKRLGQRKNCLIHCTTGQIFFLDKTGKRFSLKKPLECTPVSEEEFMKGVVALSAADVGNPS